MPLKGKYYSNASLWQLAFLHLLKGNNTGKALMNCFTLTYENTGGQLARRRGGRIGSCLSERKVAFCL